LISPAVNIEAEHRVSTERTARIGIGTVQFGQDYAIDATEKRPDDREVARILRLAATAGVTILDTASTYGNAEQVLGRVLGRTQLFRIVTKTAVFNEASIRKEDSDTLLETFRSSLAALRVQSVYGLMIHKASNLIGDGGERLFDAMQNLKWKGQVKKIGVSVYDAAQIENVMARFPVDLVQVPVSILDQRLIAGGQLKTMKEQGIEIHARSVFLKGLAFADPAKLPDHFDRVRERLQAFRNAVAASGSTPQAVALSFILDNPNIDTVLCGVTSAAQLGQIIDCISGPSAAPLPDPQRFALTDPEILNPGRWPAFRIGVS